MAPIRSTVRKRIRVEGRYSLLATEVFLTAENKTYASNVKETFRSWDGQGEKEEKTVGKCGRQNNAPLLPKCPSPNPWNL